MTTPKEMAQKRYGRYVVHRDDVTGTWRIIDLIHPMLNIISDEDEIDDNHPALTIILDGQFTALFQKAIQLGFDIDKFSRMSEMSMLMEMENNNLNKIDEDCDEDLIIQSIPESPSNGETYIKEEDNNNKNNVSETYELSSKKLDVLNKLISTRDFGSEEIEKLINGIMRIGGNGDV